MRASAILQARLRHGAKIVHAKQWASLWRAVQGLMEGGHLWLTGLGRTLPGATTDKHRIKAVDRLLGSPAIQRATIELSATLATFLLRQIRRPVILVDWTGGGSSAFYILSASLAFCGRSLPLWSRTFTVDRKCSPKAEREFLSELAAIMPRRCRPILVTDAGFLCEWFDAVRNLDWDFIGRLRGKMHVRPYEHWLPLEDIHALAGKKTKSFGACSLRRGTPQPCRVVLSRKPRLKGRHRITFNGTRGQCTADRQRGTAAREPLVLATSLNDRADSVVATYRLRMQIEESFRDLKSHRYGWSLEDVRCRSPRRVDVLLLVASFAMVAMHMIGFAARKLDLQRGLQANTERKRPVFSTFFLAKLTMRRGLQVLISRASLCSALASIFQLLLQKSPP
jgi:DDE family transposase